MRFIANIVLYQCAWFACVLGTATHHYWLGFAVIAATLLWHLWAAHAPGRELLLIGICALVGAMFESLLIETGWVRMEPAALLAGITPLWMVALWAAFATTLNVSLRSLRRRYVLIALLGAVGAPLAYAAGVRLGALQWVRPVPALLTIAIGWALALPLLGKTAQRFDGFAAP